MRRLTESEICYWSSALIFIVEDLLVIIIVRFHAFLNRCILTKYYCSPFAEPLYYSAFSLTTPIRISEKTYTISDIFFIHNLFYAGLSLHLDDISRSTNILECKVYQQQILKSTISARKLELMLSCCHSLYLLWSYWQKNIISRWWINASYFQNIKIYVGINVYTIPTLSFDMLNHIQYSHWNLITIAFSDPYRNNKQSIHFRKSLMRNTLSLDQHRST